MSTDNSVRPEGCTILSDDGAEEALVDIVIVHGLQGHPYHTWTCESSSASSASNTSSHNATSTSVKKKRGLRELIARLAHKKSSSSHLSVPEVEESSTVYWPRDLLASDFRNARIMTYGYDSSVSHFFSGAANQNSISAHGTNLLNRVTRERRDCPRRPVIFIVHSLGGLVLKRALMVSRDAIAEKQDLKDVYECTLGILFFGTPHRGGGGNYADWGIIASRVVRSVGFDANDNIVRNLRVDSEILGILREEFSEMLGDKAFQVDTFQEELGFQGVRGLTGKIVEDASSALDDAREYKHTVKANHINMCRFQGPQDEGYLEVKDVISRYMKGMKRVLADEPRACVKSLYEPLMDLDVIGSRYYQVDPNYEATLDWVFSPPPGPSILAWHNLPEWLQEGTGLFWIRGKPGSGKSTAMKYIFSHTKTRKALPRQVWQCPAVFLHNRGSPMQKTFEGLLRSVLVQLLSNAEDLISIVSPFGWEYSPLQTLQMQDNDKSARQSFLWTVDKLKAAFEAVMTKSPKSLNICIFIDALDEHDGNHEEMAQFLKGLLSLSGKTNTRLKLLVSSREEATFIDEFSVLTTNQNLQIHEWTQGDINVYVRGQLGKQPAMGGFLHSEDVHEQEKAENLMSSVVRRAEGVFLWVQLVVEDLIVALRIRPDSLDPLRRQLDDLPDKLPDFYYRILERIDVTNVREAYILIEAVLHAHRPLTIVELAHLKHVSLCKLQLQDMELDEHRMEEIERHAPNLIVGLQEICKGLLQVHTVIPPSYAPDSRSLLSLDDYMYSEDDSTDESSTSAEETGVHDGLLGPVRSLESTTEQIAVDELEHADQLRCTVQLPHQSVKDYLVQPDSLSLLFRRAHRNSIPRPIENGHVFILNLCLQLARVSERLRRPVRETRAWVHSWDCAEWTMYHAPEAERTTKMDLSDLLDRIDQYLIMADTICWPAKTRVFRTYSIDEWKITFPSYAVAQNMQIYMKARLARDKKVINAKAGRPLLFFAMWSPEYGSVVDPTMVQLLLENGADVQKKWKDGDGNTKDALQSMSYWPTSCDSNGYPHKGIIEQLFRAGANPDGVPGGGNPILHSIVQMRMDPGPKLDLLKLFKKYSADFRIKDSHGREILDVFFDSLYGRRDLPIGEEVHLLGRRSARQDTLQSQSSVESQIPAPDAFSFSGIQWLFDQGAVIAHPYTYSHPSFKQSVLYQEEFRKPQYYSYKVWQIAREQHSDWGPLFPVFHRWRGRL